MALAGTVIASHYAEPLERGMAVPAELRRAPSADAEVIGKLGTGDAFAVLEESPGWAWGYGGAERRVGYVRSDALSPGD